MVMVIQVIFLKQHKQLAANLAKENYTVHLFDLNGFGYSGGKRFNPDHKAIFRDFFSVVKLMTRNVPLIG